MLKILKTFAKKLNEDTNARLFLVGGAVRDMIMNNTPKDIDLEAFNIKPKDLLVWLTINDYDFKLEPNAKFPVIRMKLNNNEIEIGFPRRENKTGVKHSDYEIQVVPDMSFKEAARRRDFTMNAIGYDLLTDKFEDPYNGIIDIKNKILRVVNNETFKEDALRVFRAMQFIARFELDYTSVLKHNITQEMINELKHISPSSIWNEFKKMINKGTKAGIQKALVFLQHLSKEYGLFPIINKMFNTKQNPKHHAEGNVWKHTLMVIDNISLFDDELFFLTALCHDMGKVKTTKLHKGKLVAYGHEKETSDAIDFLKSIGTPNKLIKQIIKLIEIHMLNSSMKDYKWCKLADELDKLELTLGDFLIIKHADNVGRISEQYKHLDDKYRNVLQLLDYYDIYARVKKMNILNYPLPKLVNGHDIIKLAIVYSKSIKGKDIGKMLSEIRNKQYSGIINTRKQAIDFIRKRLCKR